MQVYVVLVVTVTTVLLSFATVRNKECSLEALDPPKTLRGSSAAGTTLLVRVPLSLPEVLPVVGESRLMRFDIVGVVRF